MARFRAPASNACLSSDSLPQPRCRIRARRGGVADHVHIVTTLPRTVSQAQLIEEIKKVSSKWIKALDACYRDFFWQRGYGAFSVSPSQLDTSLQYVKAQQEHHRTRTFQEEYRELLWRHGVDFDERYVWD